MGSGAWRERQEVEGRVVLPWSKLPHTEVSSLSLEVCKQRLCIYNAKSQPAQYRPLVCRVPSQTPFL